MTWVKLPDDALEDPRVFDLPDEEVLAYLRALGWSNRWARDGHVPRQFAPFADAWIAAGLAEPDGLGVQLVWLLEHQPKADEIAERQRLAVERQARHRRHMAGDHSRCDSKRCLALLRVTRDTTRDKRPSVPSRPVPTRRGEGGEESDEPDEPTASVVALPKKVDRREMRRTLGQAIRDASDPDLRKRYRRTFDREFGSLYGRGVPA